MREITDKQDFTKIKNFCFEKDNVKGLRRQATDWEKIFVKDTYHKGLLPTVYKELLRFNNIKQKTQLKYGSKTLTDTSPQKLYNSK